MTVAPGAEPRVGVLLLATANPDKARELAGLLRGIDLELRTLSDFPAVAPVAETGATLEENAVLKARAAFETTGLPALADDTGLEVEALDGRPGVMTARYAGERATYEDNWRRLLREMEGVPAARRGARFLTVIALYRGDGRILLFTGTADGRILESPRGRGGFGYDPVFYVPAAGKSFAEMTPDEKGRWSHRGDALRKLREYFEETPDPAAKAAPTDGLGHLAGRT
jgi:XTP/dITP diphosphohydrolase